MQELIKAFLLIFVAEMGDKTQILAMAFATKYPVKKVLLGIFLGAFFNHGLAVLLGSTLSALIPVNTIQIIASFAFVGFSLWTLKSDGDEEEEKERGVKLGPVFTVAMAFFIGELGDKTQLTAITLATDAAFPPAILCGTVLGMIVTGGIGIFIGKKLGDKIPELAIKLVASAIFMFFGVTKLIQTLPGQYVNALTVSIFTVVILGAVVLLIRPLLKARKQGRESTLIRTSRELKAYYRQIQDNVEGICLGPGTCGSCQGNRCIVGHTKTLIKSGMEDKQLSDEEAFIPSIESLEKDFDKEKVLTGLIKTLTLLTKNPESPEYANIHAIRKQFEQLLFQKSLDQMNSWEDYVSWLKAADTVCAERIVKAVNQ
jgi:putative Ca2+/H+ antiporter (TMEM165/GDT1 family)